MSEQCFSKEWESAWNSHDLDWILSHYSDGIVFRSNKAIPLVGNGEITGKKNLKAYWQQALRSQPNLKFEVLEVFRGYRMMVILYKNHKSIRATETLYFDEKDKVVNAAACHHEALVS